MTQYSNKNSVPAPLDGKNFSLISKCLIIQLFIFKKISFTDIKESSMEYHASTPGA
jgi:hypothetical protein